MAFTWVWFGFGFGLGVWVLVFVFVVFCFCLGQLPELLGHLLLELQRNGRVGENMISST